DGTPYAVSSSSGGARQNSLHPFTRLDRRIFVGQLSADQASSARFSDQDVSTSTDGMAMLGWLRGKRVEHNLFHREIFDVVGHMQRSAAGKAFVAGHSTVWGCLVTVVT